MNSPKTVSGQKVFPVKVVILWCVLGVLSFPRVQAGTALRLYFQNIVGNAVSDLQSHPNFPSIPSSVEIVSSRLERIEKGGDNWGSWIRGYLEAPQTGNYTFYLTSDNNSEFWLSRSHLSFEVRKLIENPKVLAREDYKVESEPIELVKGAKYYFELYHKEGTGLDHVSVGWKLPDGTLERPIPTCRLMPVPVDRKFQTQEKEPVFLVTYFSAPVPALADMTVAEGDTIVLEASIEGTQPMALQWFKNDKPVAGAILSSLTLENMPVTAGYDTFRLTASNELGTAFAETKLRVVRDDIPPVVLSAVNIGTSNTIAVIFSKPIDPDTASVASNYEMTGGVVVGSAKRASRDTVHLSVPALKSGKSYSVKVKNVKDLSRRNEIAEQKFYEVEKELIAWLQFDTKDENDVVPDSSGNFNSAVLLNGARLSKGMVGSCLELDGVDDHAILPSGFENFTNGMTVALWAKPITNAFWNRFIDFGNGEASHNILFAREAISHHLVFETYRTQLKKAIARDVVSLGVWQHLAASMDAHGNVSLYKNGVLVGKQPTNIPPVQQRTRNLIGRSNWDLDAHYKGCMDDLRIYERPLTGSEIEAIAKAGLQ